jgi:hypothetical protein
MAETTPVGMAQGHRFNINILKEWADRSWLLSLGKSSTIQTLARGWCFLKFRSIVEVEWVMKKSCSINSTPIILKKWILMFDAK